MRVFEAISDFRSYRRGLSGRVGFVPTMGYLHQGHLSLAAAAKRECDYTVLSIFVNPTQFGPNEDFACYPRDFENDARLCAEAGVDAVFAPSAKEMYPGGDLTTVNVSKITQPLCGQSRPTHFAGVTTVVAKLFNIAQPHAAYFGQKDLQQSVVIRRMVEDLNFPVEIRVCPIVREEDGLALSSRNKYLGAAERKMAVVLSQSLKRAQALFAGGESGAAAIAAEVRGMITAEIGEAGRIDYAEVVSTKDLNRVETAAAGDAVALAVFLGKTRLIDNLILV